MSTFLIHSTNLFTFFVSVKIARSVQATQNLPMFIRSLLNYRNDIIDMMRELREMLL